MNHFKYILFIAISLTCPLMTAAESHTKGIDDIIYVNKNATPGGDGSSWQTAYQHINDALAASLSGDQLWIAAGTYYPDEGGVSIADDSTQSFTVSTNVSIYGGFAGTELSINERDLSSNQTILSGDIEQDDNLNDGITEYTTDIVGTNSYRIMTVNNSNLNTLIDGLVFNAGRSNGINGETSGAGIICINNTVTIRNSLFQANYMSSRSVITGCNNMEVTQTDFINNRSGDVGSITTSSSSYHQVRFVNNNASIQAALFYSSGSAFEITNSQILGNFTNGSGPIRMQGGSLYMENVIVSGNRAGSGGTMILTSGASADLINVTMVGNYATQSGGVIAFNSTGTLNIDNSIIWNNRDTTGLNTFSSAISTNNTGTINIANSNVSGSGGSFNWLTILANDGGGNIDAAPNLSQEPNPFDAPTSVGDFRLTSDSPGIDLGNNLIISSSLDALNQPRVHNTLVDIGAVESQYVADISVTMDTNTPNIIAGDPMQFQLTIINTFSDSDALVEVSSFFNSQVNCDWEIQYSNGASGPVFGSSNVNEILTMPDASQAIINYDCDSNSLGGSTVHSVEARLINGLEINDTDNFSDAAVFITPLPTDLTAYHQNIQSQTFNDGEIGYELVIENLTSNGANNANLTYAFDSQLSCSWSINYNAGSSGDTSNGNGSIDIDLNLPGNSNALLTAFCNVSSTANQDLQNTATITWPNGVDSDPNNNSQTITTQLVQLADIAVNINPVSGTLLIGDSIDYQINIFNLSAIDLTNININSSVPAELGNCSWVCTQNTDTTCNMNTQNGFLNETIDMLGESTATYTLSCTIINENAQGLVNLSATITNDGSIMDPQLFNNTVNTSQEVIIFASGFE